MSKIKRGPKIMMYALGATTLFFGVRYAGNQGWLPTNIAKIVAPQKVNLPDLNDAQIPNVKPVAYPSTTPAEIPATLIRFGIWEWNAQDGLLFANGGPSTTKGSLMAKHGVNLKLERQDDTNVMQQQLLACAKEIHDGSQTCSTGYNAVIIMGDGAAQFAAQIDPQLKKLGPDYQVKVIGAVGYSRGEDAFMAPPQVKNNPHSFNTIPNGDTTGLLVEGVLRDGDWNIALNWEGANNIPNNPSETTYDKDAINWVNAKDYNTAASDYVAGKCEDRKEVTHGHPTGKTVHVCVNAVVTWTPGDVTIATQKGGLVKVVSSKEYRSQMPSVIIGPAHFLNQNRQEVVNLLQAAFEGGDQIKAFDSSLKVASKIASAVYQDEGGKDEHGVPYTNGAYWYRFFKPQTVRDAQGLEVSLGGSAVNNLADNLILFGMQPGANDNFRSIYNIFAGIDKQQYPELFADNGPTPLPNVKDVEDKSFVAEAQANAMSGDDGSGAAADTVDYSSVGTGSVVSQQEVHINFATGSATPLEDGITQLNQLKDSLALNALKIRIDGYTDNTGNPQANIALSQQRANAVRLYLQHVAPSTFPASRFASVQGHGSADPIADNGTSDGKAQNRRVSITLVE